MNKNKYKLSYGVIPHEIRNRKYGYPELFKKTLIEMGFITFEMAKKLKEKGYPFNTSHHYDKDGHIIVALCDCDERCEYPMPEIHQVLKWLRETKKIHISITTYDYTWGYTIYDLDTFFPEEFSSYYNTYEEAVLAGIEYTIDNLI